jgi:hypothetical protein
MRVKKICEEISLVFSSECSSSTGACPEMVHPELRKPAKIAEIHEFRD